MTIKADWQRPHPLTVLVLVAIFVADNAIPLAVVVAFGGGGFGFDTIALLVGGLTVASGGVGWFMTTFAVNDEAVHYRSGVFSRVARSIPLDRIQQVALLEPVLARAVGLAVVQVAEASADGDIEIRFLRKADATALTEQLRAIAAGRPDTVLPNTDLVVDPTADSVALPTQAPNVRLHSSSVRTLLRYKIAIAAPVLLVGVVVWLSLVVFAWYVDGVRGLALGSILGAITLVLVLGVAIVADLLVYGGFVLERTGRSLLIESGLFSRRQLELRPERVQTVSVSSGPVARRWQLHRIGFSAATGKVLQNNQPLALLSPAASTAEVAKIVQGSVDVDPAFDVELESVSPLTVRRQLVRWTLAYLVVCVPASVGLGVQHVFVGVLPTLLWWPTAFWNSRERYRRLGISLDDQRLVVRSGVVNHHLTQIPLAHVQTVSTQASFFQRRLGLANLFVVTAGVGGRNYVAIPDLPEQRCRDIEMELAAAAASTVWEMQR